MIRIALLGALLVSGCQWNNGTEEENGTARAETSPRRTASDGEAAPAKLPDRPMAEAYARPGFAVYEQDGRLWIFKPGSKTHVEYLKTGKGPAERVTLIGAGPDHKTIMGAGRESLDAYLAARRSSP